MPVYDIHCLSCDKRFERFSTIAARRDPCDCGGAVELEFHHSVQATVFIPYFDFALGEMITSMPERRKHMRNLKLDYRDKMSTGELSARRDRVEAERKERARG